MSQNNSDKNNSGKPTTDKTVVGMISSYRELNQGDWLWKQTPHPFGVWKNIQILKNTPQPDFLLMYQFDFFRKVALPTPLHEKVLHKTLGKTLGKSASTVLKPKPALFEEVTPDMRGVDCDRAIYLLREPPLPEVQQQNQENYAAAQRYCRYVSGPDAAAPMPDYMPAIWYISNSFEELDQGKIPEKVKPCSWITSGINRTESHRQRLAFLHQVQTTLGDRVEVFGRNLPSTIQTIGELQNKWSGMAPYYYNLTIENYADNEWYATEKLWDALLSWCLPIYYGGSAIDKLLPPESFLRLPSLDEKAVQYIQEIIASPDAWHERKAAIAEARKIILHKLNLLNWLSDYTAQFKS
jgi:hypothetical protein